MADQELQKEKEALFNTLVKTAYEIAYGSPDLFLPQYRKKNKLSFKGNDSKGIGMAPPTGLSRRNSNPVGKYNTGSAGSDYNSSVINANQLNNNNQTANNNSSQHRKLDRSHSEPVERSSSAQQQQHKSNINTSRYKTELCRPFEESGTCKYGDKCQFAHGSHELRTLVRHPKYKTELCRTFHTIGFCPYGPRCHFIHNADEARNKAPPSPTGSNGSSGSQPIRPKPLTFEGSAFSLGSTADSPSPPSSLSESPTSMGSFFTDEIYIPFSPPAAPAPTPTTTGSATSFPFVHGSSFMSEPSTAAVAAAVAAMNQMREASPPLGPMRRHSGGGTQAASSVSSASMDSVTSDLDLDIDLDALSLNAPAASSPVNIASAEILTGPMAVSRSLRLPVFNNLSRQSISNDI